MACNDNVRCKFSVYKEEIDEERNFCAAHYQVTCEGMHEDRVNCPLWSPRFR